MPYTVWSNDQLVGETDLDYIANTSEVKFGDFTATPFGEQIIPILMAPRQAVCARAPYDEIEALCTRRESVPLELRTPNGHVVPTDDIEITDLEWLLSLTPPAELQDELQDESWQPDAEIPEWDEPDLDEFDLADVEMLQDPVVPPVYPRFQIQVRITGGG